MVKLRLTRTGKKKQPSYRLVAAPSRSPRDGRFIEILGHYNPLTNPPTVVFKEERILHWLKEGAQATDSVRQLLVTAGIWTKFTGKSVVYPTPVSKATPALVAAPEPEPANA